ncbi:hypothetical protein TNCV_4668461 [Trichonephila clavipes]|nr:hypothetical protein TNCV_4668461 [Trichonephila clavipes]
MSYVTRYNVRAWHKLKSELYLSEGRFDLSTFRSERTNEASTLTITPKRSSSQDVGTSSYRYHTATYPPASVSANRRTNDTIFVASILDQQLSDYSTVDEIASGAAECRLTYTMANCPQRRQNDDSGP